MNGTLKKTRKSIRRILHATASKRFGGDAQPVGMYGRQQSLIEQNETVVALNA